MNLDLITREELAQELRICTATLDIWRKKYEKKHNELIPGEIHFGYKARTIRFKRLIVLNHFFGEA